MSLARASVGFVSLRHASANIISRYLWCWPYLLCLTSSLWTRCRDCEEYWSGRIMWPTTNRRRSIFSRSSSFLLLVHHHCANFISIAWIWNRILFKTNTLLVIVLDSISKNEIFKLLFVIQFSLTDGRIGGKFTFILKAWTLCCVMLNDVKKFGLGSDVPYKKLYRTHPLIVLFVFFNSELLYWRKYHLGSGWSSRSIEQNSID